MKNRDRVEAWLAGLATKDIHFDHGHIELVSEAEPDNQKSRNRSILALTASLFLGVAIIGWILAGQFLTHVRLGNTLVAAKQSDAQLSGLIQQTAKDYRLTLTYPDGPKKTFSLDNMGLQIDVPSTIKGIRSRQHQLASRLQWWRPIPAFVAIDARSNKLNNFITDQATITVQPATDAKLTLDNGTIKVTDSTAGKRYGLTEPTATLLGSINGLQSETLKLQLLSTRPSITAQQLAPYQAKLQKMLAQQVEFIIDEKSVKASSADIADWIELTPENGGKSINIAVNSGKLIKYIDKIAADTTHPPKAQVEVKHSDGTSTVLIKGVNGTDVVDKDKVASTVADNLLKNKSVQTTLSIKYAAYKTISAQAYAKWIEVDTANKRMYAYEQTSLVHTFLVSAGAPATPTVTGQYAIYAKYDQQDMRGQNVDGSNYFQPKVPWVNYFYQDYAIHGNYWRPLSYFGNINSSHGCVGIVESDAKWIYNWAPIGTPVIVHT